MNVRGRNSKSIEPRRQMLSAFTLVELLVVIAIIGVLVALLLPAIQAARASARSAWCKSNLHQLGIAVQQYCDAHHGKFPDWSHHEPTQSWILTIADYMEHSNDLRYCPEDFLLTERRYMKGTSYVINDYLAKDSEVAVRYMRKLAATSKTYLLFEGCDRRNKPLSEGDPHEYDPSTDKFVYATPEYEHAHCSQWFSKLNQDWDLVETAIKDDIQPDRHTQTAHYLFVDGHVEVIPESQIDEWIDTNFEFARPE